MVKDLPAIWETQVQPLGWEDPLEEEMATHSSILAGKIPRTEEPGGLYSPWGHRVRRDNNLAHTGGSHIRGADTGLPCPPRRSC